jgi:hypothetical protein
MQKINQRWENEMISALHKIIEVSANVKLVVPNNWNDLTAEQKEGYLAKNNLPKIIGHDILREVMINTHEWEFTSKK